jgi:thiamine-phosphate pyrophosphorylase
MLEVPRLHIITDTTVQQRHGHLELAKMAWEAGKCAVQYRNKQFSHARDWKEVKAIADWAARGNDCLIINDDAALAFELQAQGVHLGQGDGAPRDAAALLGPAALIGATVHTMAELDALRESPIHYIGVGPVYGSRTKRTGLPDLGLEGLARLCAVSPWPVIAIGGIGEHQVREVISAGAHGVAIISAFCLAPNPRHVAKRILTLLEDC